MIEVLDVTHWIESAAREARAALEREDIRTARKVFIRIQRYARESERAAERALQREHDGIGRARERQ